jgi:glycosyltransferase involved in cell wall biosynthesis
MPKKTSKRLKVALVHDYLREYGGAERVLETLHEIFPDAPVYVSFIDPEVTGIHWQKFADWDIRESWLTRIPFYKKLFSPLRLFAPQYFSAFDLSEYDVVISSTNAYFAKAVRVPNGKHICYCHTPARSLYGYTTMTDWQRNPITRFFGMLINHYLRVVDVQVARERVDLFIANSQETARRISKFYRRESTVIYPPIEVPSKPPDLKRKREYYLYVGRLAYSKHVDLAVRACTRLGKPLKVVGGGKGLDYLRSLAGPTVEFLGEVPDAQLRELYAGAKALLFPAEDEDFGMVPVEAMGYGVPVIAHRSGGPLETIEEGKTGLFFDELTVESLERAMRLIEKNKTSFSAKTIYNFTQKFKKERFHLEIMNIVASMKGERA